MDSSRRAVESYWRSLMIDGATSNEDKVAPVYKLEEICQLLRSSHVSIVKEMSEFVFRRLDHKSPIVKQKALRLIKYAVGKSGVEFRREMQRNSVAVRQLFHYKGHPDPLKGDALNKAVRDTAHEAISAIFQEESNAAPADDLNRRIQGFGNTNIEMSSDEKKSFISEVVGLGSASIKQGLTNFTHSPSFKKKDDGNYKSPNLHRSLTIESEQADRYEPAQYRNEAQNSFGSSKNVASGPWNEDSRVTKTEITNGDSSSNYRESKTREERLLETIVTSGGVRLQPTRDAILIFLTEAKKLDAVALSHALDLKLQSPLWQVRMKAICVLESILRRKDDEHFAIIESYFIDNKDLVVKCSDSPQSSLREKANKVLSLLGGEQTDNVASNSEQPMKAQTATFVQMPDLIDTGDLDDYHVTNAAIENPSDQVITNLTAPSPAPQLIDDLFGDGPGNVVSTSELKNDDDPFADVLFHNNDSKEQADDLFSGLTVDNKRDPLENSIAEKKSGPEMFDIFGPESELLQEQDHKNDLSNLMGGLSIDKNVPKMEQKGTPPGQLSELLSDSTSHPSRLASSNDWSGILNSQTALPNGNAVLPPGGMPYNIPPGVMFNPAFPSQPINYGAMGNLLAQQQFLATMSGLQHFGNLNAQNMNLSSVAGTNGGYASALPDIFHANQPNPAPGAVVNSSKKEDTKAFDFISDHIAAARDPKRVV
ncbi:VHS domain-containing protein [Pyrus ussuriensis x Pyrus communis]|uniref:VHS domain-containing protein n=1 Tax=Pyrus ussuriensis x Pyrus communis TaxID=2448454 RepID=A0A5N5GGA4_9ROSA|nr:VHS domain-containing protein [Pyrus ussuriensis x Pyrus communis]